jgi:GNAT superfamily N-acetyltransferase
MTAPAYRIRPATLDDAEVLVHHRVAMFRDMGLPEDEIEAAGPPFTAWLAEMLPKGIYRAWVVEDDGGAVVAGGGMTVLPWPPGPRYPGGQIAFVYNVYTEPAHRHRGLGRKVMTAIHDWCRERGIATVGLNASEFGLPLYESMGYQVADSPMMFLRIV